MIAMPFTYSIANGLIFGILRYVLMKLFTGKLREIHPVLAVLALDFVIYLVY